jgi:toxin ParE1/3/4
MSSHNRYSLVLSLEATEDRKDIVAYGVANWGREQAQRYNQKLKNGLAAIQLNPKIGRTHQELPFGYLLYHIERHYIIYVVAGMRIEVIRILHDRMDLSQHIY